MWSSRSGAPRLTQSSCQSLHLMTVCDPVSPPSTRKSYFSSSTSFALAETAHCCVSCASSSSASCPLRCPRLSLLAWDHLVISAILRFEICLMSLTRHFSILRSTKGKLKSPTEQGSLAQWKIFQSRRTCCRRGCSSTARVAKTCSQLSVTRWTRSASLVVTLSSCAALMSTLTTRFWPLCKVMEFSSLHLRVAPLTTCPAADQ